MSVTFYVDGWNNVPMVDMPMYAKDEYPSLDREDFIGGLGYHVDKDGEPYRIEKVPANDVVWPEVNRSNSNASGDIRALLVDPQEDDLMCGSLTADQVKNLPLERTPISLVRLAEFAASRGKGVYWI
jgi:hypothetical protein